MSIENSLQEASDAFFGFLPNLIGCLVLLVVGFLVAKLVAGALRKGTEKAGVDRRLAATGSGRAVENMMPGASAARAIGLVVFWLVFGFFIVAAVSALEVDSVTAFMNSVLAYLPNIAVAILIFVVAALVAGAVSQGAARVMGENAMGRMVSAIAPALVMVIALFMILNQLRIAEEIVVIAFAATMGALALGLGLAFGLGGRPVAQSLLEDAYRQGRTPSTRSHVSTTSEDTSVPTPRSSTTHPDSAVYVEHGETRPTSGTRKLGDPS